MYTEYIIHCNTRQEQEKRKWDHIWFHVEFKPPVLWTRNLWAINVYLEKPANTKVQKNKLQTELMHDIEVGQVLLKTLWWQQIQESRICWGTLEHTPPRNAPLKMNFSFSCSLQFLLFLPLNVWA